jgi:hypothetical protein
MRAIEFITESKKPKCTCEPGDKDPDCPVHGLEPMGVGDALDENLEERHVAAHVCKSPKQLGNSDQSQCVARGLRPRHDRKVLKGKQVYGKKIKHVKYGGPLGGDKNGKGK